MHLFSVAARTHRRHGGLLGRKHDAVKLALFSGETAVHRKGAGDVAVVVIIHAASGIDQQQITVLQGCRVGRVMEHAGIVPPGNDGAIGRSAGPGSAEVGLNGGLHLSLIHPRLRHRTGEFMSLCRNAAGLTQSMQLMPLFHQAQSMQDRRWRHQPQGGGAGAGVAVELTAPGRQHQRLDSGVTTHAEGDRFCTDEITGQKGAELIQGMGNVGSVALHGTFSAPTETGPDLGSGVLGMHKQHEPLPLRTMGEEQGNRIRLVKPGEIEKIAVLPERPLAVGVMRGQSSSGNHSSSRTKLIEETLPATGMNAGIELGQTAAGLS